jgi:hypothetical protein
MKRQPTLYMVMGPPTILIGMLMRIILIMETVKTTNYIHQFDSNTFISYNKYYNLLAYNLSYFVQI